MVLQHLLPWKPHFKKWVCPRHVVEAFEISEQFVAFALCVTVVKSKYFLCLHYSILALFFHITPSHVSHWAKDPLFWEKQLIRFILKNLQSSKRKNVLSLHDFWISTVEVFTIILEKHVALEEVQLCFDFKVEAHLFSPSPWLKLRFPRKKNSEIVCL